MDKKEMVAMVLAGGKGSRLGELTRRNAKPAIYFGGKYRIIDFVMSSIANSNIHHVGLITQYESVDITSYCQNGKIWGFDGNNSSLDNLSPRQKQDTDSAWYSGTADAIYENLDYIDKINPEYVLIVSSDHIYKMNYQKMLKKMLEKDADAIISVISVPIEEASRFGILETDDDGLVTAFVEKPKKPKSTLASMGIYIFKYNMLRDALIKDAKNEESSHDFGNDIIPYLLKKKKKVAVFNFKGYWRDVGTIDALWEANMDLIDDDSSLELYNHNDHFKVYSQDTRTLPHYVGASASIKNSLINQGCQVYGTVEHSVISTGAIIEEGATVVNSVVMPGAIITTGSYINNVIICPNVKLKNGTEINKEGGKVLLISK
jgi:glucose-1-phosphate adenylyltransferase